MTRQVSKTPNPENEEELALLRLVATGDRSALTRLYLTYHARLFKFVFRLTRSYATADELVNDIMLVVWDKAGSFRGESKVSTWIFGIAYKQTMRRVTRKQLQLTPLTDFDESGHDQDATMEIEDWVKQGLHALPAAQQLTVVLVFYLGLTYEETAEVTDCPVNTVKTRMFHARRKLKEYLSASAVPESLTGENTQDDMRRLHDHDEIDLLLAWYVNDTLEPAERDRVAEHVADCAACQESVALLTEVQAAVLRNKATPIVPQPRVNRLLESIGKETSPHRRDRRRFNPFFTAAAVTLMLIGTLIVSNPDDRSGVPQIFESATSSPDGASMDYVLRIQFESGTSLSARDRVLQDIGARDVSGGSDEGSYRVIVQLSATSLEELARYTGNLDSLPEVSSVSVVALQLPMKVEQ